MSLRHGIPHDPITCWRCGSRLADDPPSTGHEVIRVGGRNVAAHTRGNVQCVPAPPRPTPQGGPVSDPAVTMRRAADRLREPPASPLASRLADLLDDAANEAEEVGPSAYAERVAAAIVGLPDPYPRLRPPARPEATVTHVEGVVQ